MNMISFKDFFFVVNFKEYYNSQSFEVLTIEIIFEITKLKGAISDRQFHTSLFSKPQILFCIFRENFTVITYLYNNSLGNSIFLERETILCC